MKKINISIFTFICIALLTNSLKAQGLIDGFTSKKGDFSITGSYTYGTFDEFYAGKELSDPEGVPFHQEITQNIFSLYAKYGISDRVTAILNAPFINAEGKSGEVDLINNLTSVSDLQNISLALKINAAKLDFKGGNLNLITAFTVHLPTGYEPNGVLSIGDNTFGVDYTAGLHLNTDVGLFSTILAGYNLKSETENNQAGGRFEVPNSFTLSGKLGYASNFIYVEAWAYYLKSDEGVDIGAPDFTGNLPETAVEENSLGLTVYKNIMPKLGVSLGFGKVVDGRNIGASTNYSIGFTYNLNK